MTLGTLISSVRKARRLTQPELGAAMDPPRSASTVAKWEADDRSPDSDQLREICRVLHVSADVLLERAPFKPGITMADVARAINVAVAEAVDKLLEPEDAEDDDGAKRHDL